MDEQQTDGERINVTIGGGATTAAPAAPPAPAEPAAPPAPESPELPAEPEAPAEMPAGPPSHESEPALAPPSPGTVVSSGDGTIGGPPTQSQMAAVGGPRRGKGWLKALLILVLVAALAGAGWFIYQHYGKKQGAAPKAAVNKDIPLLRIGIQDADYGDLYPNMSSNDYGFSVNSQMFEGLVRYENKTNIVPDLASNWSNPDNNTWLFTVKQGIKFHDGHTLAPKDVKYSLDQMIASKSDFAQTFASTIASVDLSGNDQVKIVTKSPDPTLLNKLTFLYIIDSNLPKGDEPSQAGTGPYMIKPGTTPANKNYQMVAFDQYHLGKPQTRSLSFGSQVGADNLINAFNTGQFDIAGTISPGKISQAKNAKVFEADEADSTFIGFNTVKSSPVQNKLVREAIRYVVDIPAIAKANDETITPISQLTPPSIAGYNPAITPYKQNLTKAKQLLAQAGYSKGLTLTLSASSADSQEATEISNELKQIGVTVKIDKHNNFDEFINYFSAGKAEMFITDYASDTLDGVDIYTTTLPPVSYNNPKVTQLLSQANTTVNPATRLKLLQQVSSIVDHDVAVVPLGSTSSVWVMNKNYVIKQDTPTGYIPVYFYKVHLR